MGYHTLFNLMHCNLYYILDFKALWSNRKNNHFHLYPKWITPSGNADYQVKHATENRVQPSIDWKSINVLTHNKTFSFSSKTHRVLWLTQGFCCQNRQIYPLSNVVETN